MLEVRAHYWKSYTTMKTLWITVTLLLLLLASPQQCLKLWRAEGELRWMWCWKKAVFYQLYVRNFYLELNEKDFFGAVWNHAHPGFWIVQETQFHQQFNIDYLSKCLPLLEGVMVLVSSALNGVCVCVCLYSARVSSSRSLSLQMKLFKPARVIVLGSEEEWLH